VKNKFAVGDELELILPNGNHTFRLEEMHDMDGNLMQEVPGGGYQVQIPLQARDYAMGLLARNL
ncbi:MAG: U32 family peptidase C-terminal domain-containing protein, partial [Gammaproteobacteria bacterium]|nr:U32 family peptidase C-terminal domain-containing protein [Gammaproteobacteria bacterium]